MRALLQRFKCHFHWCGGHVVSGIHDDMIWIGWQCGRCGKVKHYAPDKRL
jgi:ribosomal protein S27AE